MLLRFIKLVFKYSKAYVFLKLFMAVLEGVFPVFHVIVPKYMIDSILEDNNFTYFVMYTVIFIVIVVLSQFLAQVIKTICDYIMVKLNKNVTVETLDRIYQMSFELYEDPNSYNTINRAFQYATGNGLKTIDQLLNLFTHAITVLSYIYIIASFNWIILLILLFGIITQFYISQTNTKANVNFKNDTVLINRKNNYFKSLLLDKYMAKEIRVLNIYNIIQQKYHSGVQEYLKKFLDFNKKILLRWQINNVIQYAVALSIYIFFGRMLFEKSISMGEYTVSLNASMQFTDRVIMLIKAFSTVYGNIVESKNYKEFLTISETPPKESFELGDKITIEFKNVYFKYPMQSNYVLKNFSYKFKYGTKYAILGPNGSSKTTIIKLILGLYKPDKGEILINNRNIENLDMNDLYKKTAVMFQDFQLINGLTIKQNIILNGKDNGINKYLNDFNLIDKFNNSGQTIDNEYSKKFANNGVEFSGGEKQKVALIRTLNKECKLLLLDEPTSAIDRVVEKNLFEKYIYPINDDKIVIFITHNSSMAKYADEIILLHNGEVIASGSYQSLIDQHERFQKIYNLAQ